MSLRINLRCPNVRLCPLLLLYKMLSQFAANTKPYNPVLPADILPNNVFANGVLRCGGMHQHKNLSRRLVIKPSRAFRRFHSLVIAVISCRVYAHVQKPDGLCQQGLYRSKMTLQTCKALVYKDTYIFSASFGL